MVGQALAYLVALGCLAHADPVSSAVVLPRLVSLTLLLGATCSDFIPCARADHPASGFAHGIGGPIVTIPAGTLPRGSWAASMRVEWVRFDALSNTELAEGALRAGEVHSTDALLSPSVAIGYGITNHLTLGARLPYVARYEIREAHLHGGVPGLHDHGDSKGFGDVSLLAQFRFLPGENGGAAAALLAGVKIPSGEKDVEDEEGDRFEVEHQPGTGSLDRLLGAAWSQTIGKAAADANVLATLATEGSQDTRLGHLVNYNLALSFRPGQHEHPHGAGEAEHPHEHQTEGRDQVSFDLVAEANGEWRGPTDIAGAEEDNSGGSLVYLSPGMRVGTQAWSLSASVGVPVVQELRGEQHETTLRLLVGLGVAF
jgi:hypothetical protein